jgi:hypothetical protein
MNIWAILFGHIWLRCVAEIIGIRGGGGGPTTKIQRIDKF